MKRSARTTSTRSGYARYADYSCSTFAGQIRNSDIPERLAAWLQEATRKIAELEEWEQEQLEIAAEKGVANDEFCFKTESFCIKNDRFCF